MRDFALDILQVILNQDLAYVIVGFVLVVTAFWLYQEFR